MTPAELSALVSRLETEEQYAGEELQALADEAEQSCDYRAYDERRFDQALESEDRLTELLNAVKAHLTALEG